VIDFSRIAEPYLKEHRDALEKRCCPDQFVGLISDIERFGDFIFRSPASERPADIPSVLLILESPHIYEFDELPGPAKGHTGRNIVRYLRQVSGLHDKAEFGLILLNAVQFQCSLGRPTSEVRDAVFVKTWTSGGSIDFESRFRAVYRDGDCVVNCCTRGTARSAFGHLRVHVQQVLAPLLPSNSAVLCRNHPSSWHFPANRTRNLRYAI